MPALPEESMLVEQVMHDNPETLTPEHKLEDALAVYERHGVNCVPILDADKKIRGILTIFRLVEAIRQGKSFETTIGEVMDVDLVSIRNDATFGAACSLPIDRMLVLDHEDKLVGVLTKKDLIHKIYNAFCSADCHNRELDAVINCAADGIIIFDQAGVPLYTNDNIRSLLPDCDNLQEPGSPAMAQWLTCSKRPYLRARPAAPFWRTAAANRWSSASPPSLTPTSGSSAASFPPRT